MNFVCAFLLFASLSVWAQGFPSSPELVYRGAVAGGSLPANPEMKLRLWKSATSSQSTDIICDPQVFVPVTVDSNGRFDVQLDVACIEAIRNGTDVYAELEIRNVGTIRPRSALKAVPFALRAERVSGSWRSAMLEPGWLGYTRCRRLGDTVIISIYAYNTAVAFSGAASKVIATLPADCRPTPTSPDSVGAVSLGPGGGVPGSWAGFAFLNSPSGQISVACPTSGEAATFCSGTNQKTVTGTLIAPFD